MDSSVRPLLVVSGPSGVGKSTLISRLALPGGVSFITPYTTRTKREEEDDRDYHFVRREEFQEMVRQNALAHWDYALGNYYGFDPSVTRSGGITHSLARMALRIRHSRRDVTLIFMRPKNIERHFQRLQSRFTDPLELHLRRLHFEEEVAHASLFDHVLSVDGADDALGADWQEMWRSTGVDI